MIWFTRFGVLDRVAKMPEIALHFFMVHFVVGDGGLQLSVPVDQSFSAKDQPVFEHLEERIAHRLGQPVVKRESFARPVT